MCGGVFCVDLCFFFQEEDGIRDAQESRGLGDVYKRQVNVQPGAEVKEGQEPVFALFDMGSRNGIYAGPKDSYKDEENRVYRHELQDGDYLLMGETTLVFKKL